VTKLCLDAPNALLVFPQIQCRMYGWFVLHEVLTKDHALMTMSTSLCQHHKGTMSLDALHLHGGGSLLLSEKPLPTGRDFVDFILNTSSVNRDPASNASGTVTCIKEHTIWKSLSGLSPKD